MAAKKKVAKKAKVAGKGKLVERAFGPAADEFGKELAPLGQETGAVSIKVGRMLLTPIRGLVTGLDAVGNWLHRAISERLKNVPEDQIVAPDSRIAVPAVQALTYSIEEEFIREMFANLLAADMNAERKRNVHPAFVDLIRQLTALDASILRQLGRESISTEYYRPNDTPDVMNAVRRVVVEALSCKGDSCELSLDNLQRLRLVEIVKELLDDFYEVIKENSSSPFYHVQWTMRTTTFGNEFVKVCLPAPP